MNNLSFSDLRNIFMGAVGAEYCAKALLFLKSPYNAKEYLTGIHKVAFPNGDTRKKEKWNAYPKIKSSLNVNPIQEKDLSDPEFMKKQANKLSFDISRFTEFLTSYNEVDDNIKPIMLHYGWIYLLDFLSRTWLKYGQNRNHGIGNLDCRRNKCSATIQKSGLFHRAVDAFYFLDQSSLFSPDEDGGIGYIIAPLKRGTISKRIRKMKYSKTPKINLTHLFDVYERLGKIAGSVSKSNPILVGYVILFILSSVSRYRAEDWFKIRENRNLKNKFDLLQYDFLYKWTHEIFMQTILTKGLKKELSISSE